MVRKKLRALHMILGIAIGTIIGHYIRQELKSQTMCTKTNTQPTNAQFIATANINLPPDKTLIFVGVMTAAKYLETRAKAVYNTWGTEIPGKIVFFSSQQSQSNSVPLVALPDVDDRYPPQKKSFRMLKYMHDNYIDQFEWFLRADDDVYIRAERLEQFLRSIDSTKPQFIGQAGRGNNEEFGLLSLDYDENFCMGGPGIILSRETLKRIAPYLEECLNNLYTTHEDVEVGRCVRKYAGIPCTWSYEMQSILHHNQSGESAFTGNLKTREVHRAITLHPIKQPSFMYRLHNYFKELKIQSLKFVSIQTHREIVKAQSHLHGPMGESEIFKVPEFIANEVPLQTTMKGSPQYLGDTNLLGVDASLTRHKPKNMQEVLTWNFISRSLYSASDSNPRKKLDTALADGLNDVIREVMETINMYSKQRGRVIEFKEILYAYMRVDSLHGVDWVLDLLMVYKKYRGHKMTVPVRRHAYVQQTFTGMEIREVEMSYKDDYSETDSNTQLYLSKDYIGNRLHKTLHDSIKHIKNLNILPLFSTSLDQQTHRTFPNQIIHVILPLSGRYETFVRFLSYYEEVCIKTDDTVRLYIILYKDSNNDYQRVKKLVSQINDKYVRKRHYIKIIEMNKTFSRGEALQVGVDQCCDLNDLVFFIDVDIVFKNDAFTKIRLNTVRNKQVYFPILFSEYSHIFNEKDICSNVSDLSLLKYSKRNREINFDVSDDLGYWRLFGYGIMSAYKCDLINVGGFNTTISGWGLEDVTVFDKFVKSSIRIFRASDPSLRHVYHVIECDPSLSDAQMQMCLGSQANTLGSIRTLQKFINRNQFVMNSVGEYRQNKLNRPGS